MAKARPSGITVSPTDVPIILGMVHRGDRRHDIAAWFGLNQGRITEVEDGVHGTAAPAPERLLPPSGSPGPKAKELRRAVEAIHRLLNSGNPSDIDAAKERLRRARSDFDKNQ